MREYYSGTLQETIDSFEADGYLVDRREENGVHMYCAVDCVEYNLDKCSVPWVAVWVKGDQIIAERY